MKGYTNFYAGFFGPGAIATRPIGEMKYLDWEKARKICEAAISENPNAIISAGLREDWNNTSGTIYENGEYVREYVYGSSCWATPIVDVDGVEYDCWTHEKPKDPSNHVPSWWTRKESAK